MVAIDFKYINCENNSINVLVKVKKNSHPFFYIRFHYEVFSKHIRKFHGSALLCTLDFYHILTK